MNAVYICTWPAEQALAAERKTFLFNLASALGSVLSLAGSVLSWWLHGPVAAFVFAYYLSIVFPAVAMFVHIRADFGLTWADYVDLISNARKLLRSGLRIFGFQVSGTFKLHLSLPLVALALSTASVAAFGSGMRFCTLFVSGISILLNPLLAESGHAWADGFQSDFRLFLGRVLAGGLLVGAASTILLAAFGPQVFDVWLHDVVKVDRPACFWLGLFVSTYSMELLLFYTTFSFPKPKALNVVLSVEGIASLMLGWALMPTYGITGMLFALTLGNALGLLAIAILARHFMFMKAVSTNSAPA